MAALIIGNRYNGPAGSGNGGYCAGQFALRSGLDPAGIEVTLRRPPPLESELQTRAEANGIDVYDGPQLVAEVRPTAIEADEIVEPVSWTEAVAASARYPGLLAHPFPACFVCGPERAEGDGLRLFPGRLPDGRTATPFRVPAEISAELIWAALDCPGGWAVPLEGRPYVLGRLRSGFSMRQRPTSSAWSWARSPGRTDARRTSAPPCGARTASCSPPPAPPGSLWSDPYRPGWS